MGMVRSESSQWASLTVSDRSNYHQHHRLHHFTIIYIVTITVKYQQNLLQYFFSILLFIIMVDFSVCPRHSIVHCVTQVTDYPPPFYKPFTIWPCQYMSSAMSCMLLCYTQPLWLMDKLTKSQQDPWGPKVLQRQLNSEKILNDLLGTLPHALNLRPSQDSLESAACPWRGRLQILTIAQSFDVTYFQCSACFYRVRSGSGSISRAISPCISPSTVQVYNCTCISLGALNTALFFFRTSSVSPQRMPCAVFSALY